MHDTVILCNRILFGLKLIGLRHQDSERGSHLLELTIALPVFLGCLFGVFDSARMTLGYSAVRSAVYQGARRGIAEYRPVDNATFNAAFAINPAATNSLSFFPFESNGGTASWYGSENDAGPSQVFRVEALSMAYAYRIIGESTAASKWPCLDEPGCVACVAMRTADQTYRDLFCKEGDASCLDGSDPNYPVNYLGLKCTYNVPITTTSIAFGWLPRYIPVSATTYVSMANYARVEFDANI